MDRWGTKPEMAILASSLASSQVAGHLPFFTKIKHCYHKAVSAVLGSAPMISVGISHFAFISNIGNQSSMVYLLYLACLFQCIVGRGNTNLS